MGNFRWVLFGIAPLRFELFGEIVEGETAEDPDTLTTLAAIRVRNLENDELSEVVYLDIDSLNLIPPIPLTEESSPSPTTPDQEIETFPIIQSLPLEEMVFEGLEHSDELFFSLLDISGWKLVMERAEESGIRVRLYLIGDWAFDTHPDYFPGPT